MKKKSIAILALPLVIIALFIILRNNSREVYTYNSKAIYVYNLTDDREVLAENENEKLPMASLTKMMTVLLGLEKVNDLNAIAPVDIETYQKLVEENASMAGFYGGEQTTYRDLLYGAMLPSGGEAANSIAINISGSIISFVELMNEKAEELELENTHFQNPDGLDQLGHYSTAKDMAMLLKYALQNEDYRAIFTRKDYNSSSTADHPDGVYMQSTVFEKLDQYQEEGFEIIGGKSGTTEKAGQCWATLSVKNGKEYIIVVMGSPYEDIDNPENGQIRDTLDILERL